MSKGLPYDRRQIVTCYLADNLDSGLPGKGISQIKKFNRWLWGTSGVFFLVNSNDRQSMRRYLGDHVVFPAF